MNSTPETPKALTDAELADAFWRVSKIFDAGCDRCNGDDLALLEEAGLMRVETCRDTFGHDTLEEGEPMWSFIPRVETLRTIFEATQAKALAEARNDALEEGAKFIDEYPCEWASDDTWLFNKIVDRDAEFAAALRALKTPTPTGAT